MTGKQSERSSAVKQWSKRAQDALGDALALIQQGGSPEGIANRSYHAMHCAMVALLRAIDQAAIGRDEVLALFDKEFVKSKTLTAKLGKLPAEAAKLAEAAESEKGPRVTNEQAFEMYNSAAEFVAAIEEKLPAG